MPFINKKETELAAMASSQCNVINGHKREQQKFCNYAKAVLLLKIHIILFYQSAFFWLLSCWWYYTMFSTTLHKL